MSDYFKEKPEPLGRVVPKEQEAFIKLMIEDKEFLFRVVHLIDQNWFAPAEMRDVVRTIRDMYADGVEITYDSVYSRVSGHYDVTDLSKEISLIIIKDALDECQEGGCIDRIPLERYRDVFINRLVERRYEI